VDRLDEGVVAVVTALLADENRYLRVQAADVLARMDRVNEGVVAAVTALLTDEDRYLRLRAADFLARVDRVDEGVVAAVTALLTDLDGLARVAAADLLARLGPVDEGALEALVRSVDDDPWAALAAMSKARSGRPLDSEDGIALARLVSTGDDDTDDTRAIRRSLYDLLSRTFETATADDG